jgi:hypothetical protein
MWNLVIGEEETIGRHQMPISVKNTHEFVHLLLEECERMVIWREK